MVIQFWAWYRTLPKISTEHGLEYAFFQFHEVINIDDLVFDVIDTCLNCVRLKWQRTEREEGKLLSSKKFGIIPIDSVWGLVHFVLADGTMSLTYETVSRKKLI